MTKEEVKLKLQELYQKSVKETFEIIQEFALSKLKFWNAVPYFALLAQRTNILQSGPQYEPYNEHSCETAYMKKQWILPLDISYADTGAHIDLINGAILSNTKSMTVAEEIYRDWMDMSDISIYDGEWVINDLIKQAGNNKIEEKWRQKALKKYKIEIPHAILLLK